MKKYLEAGKVIFKAQLAYRFDIIISMVFTISKILLAYVLWGAIFGNQKTVAGFSFNAMISYYIINSFMNQLDQSAGTGRQIADEIRDGLFSKYMLKPMSVFGYFAAQTAGVSAFLLSFNLIAALLWVLLFRVDFIITYNIVLIGSLLPLALLPSGIIAVMKFFPFYYVSYLPSMLLLGRNGNEIITGILTLVLWNTVFYLLNSITYKRLRIQYDGVGI